MKKTLFYFLIIFANSTFASIDLDQILAESFPATPKETIILTSLKGGFSGTALYKVNVEGKHYVLRIHQSDHLTPQDENEHFSILEASKRGLAPKIDYVSPDNRALLMEFVDGKTLTFDEAQLRENCIKIAKAIRQAHHIEGHPHPGPSLLSDAILCHGIVKNYEFVNQDEINESLELVKKYSDLKFSQEVTKVRIHGDLNPRNIFLTESGVLFIDWAENTLEDPFYDLSYFAQKLGYNDENEHLLLSTYLERSPTTEELNRYKLQKKLHQAFWSLTNLYLAEGQHKKFPLSLIDATAPLKEWAFYQKEYANSSDEFQPQYFFDLSRLNFHLSKDAPR